MPAPSVKLSQSELAHALSYIEATKSSDFFPEPFEVAALRHSWDKVCPVLEQIELLNYSPKQAYEMVASKQRALVRPVHLLDPVDLILYTGLTIRLAPAIQRKRNEYQTAKVFSARFDAQQVGKRGMFASNWDAYIAQAYALCMKHKYVGTADIVDFFPRVYLHRLDNALSAACDDSDSVNVRAMMRLLDGWAHGTSYGIPTGPRASNFLAEALLIEVDEYLLSCDIEFVRWTDDYLVFGGSEEEVVTALHRLGARLNQTEGLSLNPAKTRIRKATEYRQHALRYDDSTRALRATINEIIVTGPYEQIDYDDLTDDQKAAIDRVDAERILSEALEGDLVDLRAVKFVLRFLSAFRRPDLVDPVLDNLPKLLPVADSVAKFFDVLDEVEDAAHADIGNRLIEYVMGEQFVPDFQAMWLIDPFTKSSNWNNVAELRKLAREAPNRFVRRQATLGLRQLGSRSALLDAKSALDDSRDWEERAILFACSKLPKDEYDAIVSHVGGHGGQWTAADVLRKSVLVYAKSAQ